MFLHLIVAINNLFSPCVNIAATSQIKILLFFPVILFTIKHQHIEKSYLKTGGSGSRALTETKCHFLKKGASPGFLTGLRSADTAPTGNLYYSVPNPLKFLWIRIRIRNLYILIRIRILNGHLCGYCIFPQKFLPVFIKDPDAGKKNTGPGHCLMKVRM